MKKLLLSFLLFLFSFSAFAYMSIGFETGLRYNRVEAVAQWSGGSRNVNFNQMQFNFEFFNSCLITKNFELGAKLALVYDLLSSNNLYDIMRTRFSYMAKVEPKIYINKSLFINADILFGQTRFTDNGNTYNIIGCDAGVGLKMFEKDDVSGFVKAYFEYIRGSYSNDFSLGLNMIVSFDKIKLSK